MAKLSCDNWSFPFSQRTPPIRSMLIVNEASIPIETYLEPSLIDWRLSSFNMSTPFQEFDRNPFLAYKWAPIGHSGGAFLGKSPFDTMTVEELKGNRVQTIPFYRVERGI